LPSKIHHFNIKTPQNTSKRHFPITNTSKTPFSYQNRLKITIFLSIPTIFLSKIGTKPSFSHQKHLKTTIFPLKTPFSYQESAQNHHFPIKNTSKPPFSYQNPPFSY
jgi:hypothetical protein